MTTTAGRSATPPLLPSPAVKQLCMRDPRFERVPSDEAFAREVLEQLVGDGDVML